MESHFSSKWAAPIIRKAIDLTPHESVPIGIWGQRRRCYLKANRQPIYTALFLGGELDCHLSEIDAQAEAMFLQLVKQLAKREGITEQLKAKNQMEWVKRMNSVRNRTEEILYNELIYVCETQNKAKTLPICSRSKYHFAKNTMKEVHWAGSSVLLF